MRETNGALGRARGALASPSCAGPPAEGAGSGVRDVTRGQGDKLFTGSRQARWALSANYFAIICTLSRPNCLKIRMTHITGLPGRLETFVVLNRFHPPTAAHVRWPRSADEESPFFGRPQ